MSRLLPDEVRRELARSKLLPRSARPTVGVGERRSRALGPGLEFADFRAYQPGDDIRYLDRHVRTRLGQDVIRQFSIDKQLQVTVLVDASESMAFGEPAKMQRALELCAALVYTALRSGDRARVGVGRAGGLEWHPTVSGQRGIGELLAWLERVDPAGAFEARRVAGRSRQVAGEGMLFVISDFLVEDAPGALDLWGDGEAETIGVQVLAPSELSAGWLTGQAHLEDAETGERLTFDAADHEAGYAAALNRWQEELAARVRRHGGTWFAFSSQTPTVAMLKEMRAKGLLR